MHVYDKETGIIFYSQVAQNAIGCWNTDLSHEPNNFHLIVQDNTTMIYPSDINVSSIAFRSFIFNQTVEFIHADRFGRLFMVYDEQFTTVQLCKNRSK